MCSSLFCQKWHLWGDCGNLVMKIAENIILTDLKVMFKLENCRGNLYLIMPSLVLFAGHHPSCLRPRWDCFSREKHWSLSAAEYQDPRASFPLFLFANSYLRLPGPYIFLSWRQKVLIDSRKIKGRLILAHSTYGRLSYYFFKLHDMQFDVDPYHCQAGKKYVSNYIQYKKFIFLPCDLSLKANYIQSALTDLSNPYILQFHIVWKINPG